MDGADDATPAAMVDDIAGIAGEYLCSMTIVAGNARKVESVLAALYARHLRPTLGGTHQTLVAGLAEPRPIEPDAIQSIDWVRPTAGELGLEEAASAHDHRSVVAERRELWARNGTLFPPLVIGTLPRFVAKFHGNAVAKMRAPAHLRDGMLEGTPASPGRATGVARVLADLADAAGADRLAPGEILVPTAMTPAWTPLFGRAAAVATDGGSLVAHASLVAREYGLPAVAALGDATRRVRDGRRITVDGNAGLLELHDRAEVRAPGASPPACRGPTQDGRRPDMLGR